MCYMHNEWYDILCATLYMDKDYYNILTYQCAIFNVQVTYVRQYGE